MSPAPTTPGSITNNTQIQTTLATLVGIIAGFLAGRGVFGWDQATWITVITSAVGFAGLVWTAVATRRSQIVSSAASMPEVKEITLDPTVKGSADLSNITPDNVVVK